MAGDVQETEQAAVRGPGGHEAEGEMGAEEEDEEHPCQVDKVVIVRKGREEIGCEYRPRALVIDRSFVSMLEGSHPLTMYLCSKAVLNTFCADTYTEGYAKSDDEKDLSSLSAHEGFDVRSRQTFPAKASIVGHDLQRTRTEREKR